MQIKQNQKVIVYLFIFIFIFILPTSTFINKIGSLNEPNYNELIFNLKQKINKTKNIY